MLLVGSCLSWCLQLRCSCDAFLQDELPQLHQDAGVTLPLSPQAAGGASTAALLRTTQALLELWDGVCAYFSPQAKPAAWMAMLLKALRLVPPETRAAAAAAAQVLLAWC